MLERLGLQCHSPRIPGRGFFPTPATPPTRSHPSAPGKMERKEVGQHRGCVGWADGRDTSAPHQHGCEPVVRMISCPRSYPSRERENSVQGNRILRRPWLVSAGPDESLETGWAGGGEQLRFYFRFLGPETPGAEAFVWREGAVPDLYLLPPFVGRTHSPPPGALSFDGSRGPRGQDHGIR